MPQQQTLLKNDRFIYYILPILVCLLIQTNICISQISGTVTDKKTGSGLAYVNVMVKQTFIGTTTNTDGYFELSNIPPGRYDILFSMIGYTLMTKKQVEVLANEKSSLEIELKETPIEAPNVVVSASKRVQRIEDSPTSISVVSAKDIEQRNEIYIDKILEHVPGVTLMGNQVNIRGSSGYTYGAGSRVLFLVDGVPVITNDTGRIEWDMISTSQVDRVEVVKSAGSALYGSSALGGVINVITKESGKKPEINLRLSSGFYDDPPWPEWKWTNDPLYFTDIDVDYSRRIGSTQLFLSTGRHQSTGYHENGRYERYNASSKVRFKLNKQQNLTIMSNYQVGESGVGLMWRNMHQALEVDPVTLGDKVNASRFNSYAIHQWVVNQKFRLKTRLSWFRNHFDYDMYDNQDYSTAHRIGLEIQGNYMLTKGHSLTFGTEESGDYIESNPLGSHDIYIFSAYIQDEYHLIPQIILSAGVRYDYTTTDNDIHDAEVSPKFSLVWHMTDLTTFRVSSGKGFRAPSISERFPDVTTSGLKIIPNTNLRPETTWSHELGLSTPLSPFLLFDIAFFRNEYWNLIEPVPDKNNHIQFVNLTQARISGVETSLSYSLWNRFITGQIGYTYLDPVDIESNETLGYRSHHTVNASMTGRFRNWELGMDYRYADKLEVVRLYPNDPRVPQEVLNLRFAFRMNNWILSMNTNNVLNHMHTQMERTIMPVRHYSATLKIKL